MPEPSILPQPDGPTAPFQLGLIGLANQGKEHLQAASRSTKVQFVAVCDSNPTLLDEVRAQHPGLACYQAVEQLVADPAVQGIVLALPHHVYPTYWELLAQSGKPLLKEKPLGRNLDEARAFVEAVETAGGLLWPAIQRREHPSYVALKRRLTELSQAPENAPFKIMGMEASLYLGFSRGLTDRSWRGQFTQAGGGVLLDAGYHLVDLAHYILGSIELLGASLWLEGYPARPEDLEDEAIVHARGGAAWVRLACGRHATKQERVVLETSRGVLEATREGVSFDGVEFFRCERDWQHAMADQLDVFADAVREGLRNTFVVAEQIPAMAFIERAYGMTRLNLPGGVR